MNADHARPQEVSGVEDGAIDVRFSGAVHDGVDVVLMAQPRHQGLIADVAVYETVPVSPGQVREVVQGASIGKQIERDHFNLRVGA